MIKLVMLLLLNIAPLEPEKTEQEHSLAKENTASCFSEANFESVYKFLENKIKQGGFHVFEGNELYVKEGMQIVIKEENYTLAIIHKEHGIYSLAKVLTDNQHLLKRPTRYFVASKNYKGNEMLFRNLR